MKRIIVIVILIMFMYTSIATADMKSIEAIRKEVGEEALIVQVPDHNCTHIYVVKKNDRSIWVYSGKAGFKNTILVRKALIFKPDKDVHH